MKSEAMNHGRQAVALMALGALVLAGLDCSRSSRAGLSAVMGEEVLVSTNPESILKCEPSVAMTDKVIVAAWNDSYGGMRSGRTPGVVVGWAISKDRGKSFEFGGYLPEFEQKESYMGADAWFQTDKKGNIFLNILHWGTDKSEMSLYSMNRKDLRSFEKIAHPMSLSKDIGIIDRPIMFVDDEGRIWISYTEGTVTDKVKRMRLIGSDDGGRTWDEPRMLSEPTPRTRGGGVPVACLKNNVLAVWEEGEKLARIDEVWYALSKDGGKTFPRSKMFHRKEHGRGVAPEGYSIGMGLGPISMDTTPVLGVVRGKNGKGFFFLTVIEATENGSRLRHFHFDPEEETFVEAGPLSTSPDSVFKMLPASPSKFGYPAVLYYDRRNDLHNETLTDVYLNIGTGAGGLEIKLNTLGSNWSLTGGDKAYAPFQRNFGDYISLAPWGDRLYAVWTDGRDGRPRIYGRLIELK